jgi:hypothetical protein
MPEADSPADTLALALRLWPGVRDGQPVEDPTELDRLLATQGKPGAAYLDGGVQHTFAGFAAGEAAEVTLPTGEQSQSEAEARFLAHLLVTRTLLAAGLHVDPRVIAGMSDAFALTWTVIGGDYPQSPLVLATTLWLIALDPASASDRPLPIDWSPEAFQDPARWDLEYRLFSHYDIRGRALDWAVWAASDAERREGVSSWALVEPLLRLTDDARAGTALAAIEEHGGADDAPASAVAMLERGRIAALLQGYVSSAGG